MRLATVGAARDARGVAPPQPAARIHGNQPGISFGVGIENTVHRLLRRIPRLHPGQRRLIHGNPVKAGQVRQTVARHQPYASDTWQELHQRLGPVRPAGNDRSIPGFQPFIRQRKRPDAAILRDSIPNLAVAVEHGEHAKAANGAAPQQLSRQHGGVNRRPRPRPVSGNTDGHGRPSQRIGRVSIRVARDAFGVARIDSPPRFMFRFLAFRIM
jgi:hypothetical protein